MTEKPDYSVYLVFSGDTERDAAIARYVQRYEREPEKVYEFNQQVWVGPVPEKEDDHR